MTGAALVFLGGGLGAVLRFLTVTLCARLFGPAFPWGTLAVNVIGGFAMGVLAAVVARQADPLAHESWRLFLGTGLLGGFTTFSAFSLDAWALFERGATGAAVAYVLASVALSIAGLVAGVALTRAVLA